MLRGGLEREVVGFASGVDPEANMVFECFYFAPRESGIDGDGRADG